MNRPLHSNRARLLPESLLEWFSATASHAVPHASAPTVDVQAWLLALPDDGSLEPPPGVVDRILGHRDVCEDAVVRHVVEDSRTPGTLRTGYRAVHLIGILGEWRSERAIQPLVDRLRAQRLFGAEETVLALTRIGAGAAAPLSRLLSDSSASPIARANALRVLCGLLQSTRGSDVPPSFQRLNESWRRRLLSETLLLVSDPTTADELRHESILRLCDLRATHAWPAIARAFRLKQVPDRYGLCVDSARDIIEGRMLLLDLPTWHTPMRIVE